jgi:hypothetical protein
VFQDDNAPVHRARIVERYKHDNNIYGMAWPAQSLDFNVIENCWLRIKRILQYHAGGIFSGRIAIYSLVPKVFAENGGRQD